MSNFELKKASMSKYATKFPTCAVNLFYLEILLTEIIQKNTIRRHTKQNHSKNTSMRDIKQNQSKNTSMRDIIQNHRKNTIRRHTKQNQSKNTSMRDRKQNPVSYTHLTLPTILLV